MALPTREERLAEIEARYRLIPRQQDALDRRGRGESWASIARAWGRTTRIVQINFERAQRRQEVLDLVAYIRDLESDFRASIEERRSCPHQCLTCLEVEHAQRAAKVDAGLERLRRER